jgi:hypothetical protein
LFTSFFSFPYFFAVFNFFSNLAANHKEFLSLVGHLSIAEKKIVLTTFLDDSVVSLLRHFYSCNNLQFFKKDLNLWFCSSLGTDSSSLLHYLSSLSATISLTHWVDVLQIPSQGILTEGEGSVRLTSLH